MVSIRDDAIPDADTLADPSTDPFHGTIFATDYTTIDPTGDWEYQDPSNNPNSDKYESPDLDFGDATPGPPESDPATGTTSSTDPDMNSNPLAGVDIYPGTGSSNSGMLGNAGATAIAVAIAAVVAGIALLGDD